MDQIKTGNHHIVMEDFPVFFSKHFWKEHTFWSDGYFACPMGEASPETIRRYI